MNNQTVSVVRLTFFKHSHQSFTAALDEARIPHGRVQLFSTHPQASGIIESISALSDAMLWNSLAKVIISWIEARKSRGVIIQTEDGRAFHAKGYSVNDIQKLLRLSANVTVIDTKPVDDI